jgi:glycosyltransferase involved in cell wall biosynthesis
MAMPVLVQLRRWKVDVVLTNTSVIGVGALAAYFLRKPHIWHIREFCRREYGSTFDLGTRLSIKLIGRLSALVIVNSKAVGAYYARYIPERQIRMVYNGVEVQGQPGTEPNLEAKSVRVSRAAKLVLVGTIQEGKGQTDAVRALGQLISQGVQAELTLVGPSAPGGLERVQRLVSSCGLEKLVEFTGQVPNPGPIVLGSDIALMCSRSEAFGRVTVEAMKLGKPVVGARGGATPELIQDNFNGLLYTPGDCLDLAQKIKFLIDNPEVARQMGDNGRRWAEKEFTLGKYAGEVLQVLEEMLYQRAA